MPRRLFRRFIGDLQQARQVGGGVEEVGVGLGGEPVVGEGAGGDADDEAGPGVGAGAEVVGGVAGDQHAAYVLDAGGLHAVEDEVGGGAAGRGARRARPPG